MPARFRDFLQRLTEVGELERVADEVDLRHISARVAASPKALWFERVRGYDMGVVSGILGSRARMGVCLDCEHRDIGKSFGKRVQERRKPERQSRRSGQRLAQERSPGDRTYGIEHCDFPLCLRASRPVAGPLARKPQGACQARKTS